MNRYFVYLILLINCVLVIFLDDNFIRHNIHWFFLFQLSFLILLLIKRKFVSFIFTPTILCIFYISLSFILGSIFYKNDWVLSKSNIISYSSWRHLNISISFFLFSIFGTFVIDEEIYRKRKNRIIEIKDKLNKLDFNKKFYYFFLFIFLLFSLIFGLNLSFLGADGDLSFVIKAVFVLSLFFFLSSEKVNFRFVLYLIIFFGLSVVSFDNKRETIFLIFPLAYLEFSNSMIKVNFAILFKMLFVSIILVLLIILMSLLRGYGGFLFNSFQDLINIPFAIFSYFMDDLFLSYIGNNLEFNYMFFHSFNSVDSVLKHPELISNGETLMKPLFLGVPKDIVPFKPNSFIHLYTNFHDPAFRAIGGSWPANFFAEFFWNFHFFGILPLFLLFFFLTKVHYWFFLKTKKGLFSYTMFYLIFLLYFLFLIRGSGLDLFLVYFILSSLVYFICYFLNFIFIFLLKSSKAIN
jgi:hypothetical protein